MKIRLTMEVPEAQSVEDFLERYGNGGLVPLQYGMTAEAADVFPSDTDLSDKMVEAETQGEPEKAVTQAIQVYLAAKQANERFVAVQERAKSLISDVMSETGKDSFKTAVGSVTMSAASTTVSYDAKALDILLKDDPDLAMRLGQYRKESQRAGSMRITEAK